jgi:UTP-glucose-1-phosphate uridylyltransferase
MVVMQKSRRLRKAVFPIGGLGTRFLPFSRAVPKEMLPVNQKPLIHYAVEEAIRAGIEQFIFVTGRNKDVVENYFDCAYELRHKLGASTSYSEEWLPEPGKMVFTRQQEPLGLGHAVWCARHIVGDEPFAVILSDELCLAEGDGLLAQMMRLYSHTQPNIVAVQEIPLQQSALYGMIKTAVSDDAHDLKRVVDLAEKPLPEESPSNLAIIGRYIFSPQIFTEIANLTPDANREIQLTDAMKGLIVKQDIFAFQHLGKRFDCGNQQGFLAANVALTRE